MYTMLIDASWSQQDKTCYCKNNRVLTGIKLNKGPRMCVMPRGATRNSDTDTVGVPLGKGYRPTCHTYPRWWWRSTGRTPPKKKYRHLPSWKTWFDWNCRAVMLHTDIFSVYLWLMVCGNTIFAQGGTKEILAIKSPPIHSRCKWNFRSTGIRLSCPFLTPLPQECWMWVCTTLSVCALIVLADVGSYGTLITKSCLVLPRARGVGRGVDVLTKIPPAHTTPPRCRKRCRLKKMRQQPRRVARLIKKEIRISTPKLVK